MLLLPSAGLPLAGSFRRSLWPSCQPRRFTVRPVRRDGSGGQERLCHRLGPSHRPREFCFVDGVIGLFHANISFFHIQLGSTTPLYNPRSCPICTSDKQSVPFGTHSSQPNTHVKIRSTKKFEQSRTPLTFLCPSSLPHLANTCVTGTSYLQVPCEAIFPLPMPKTHSQGQLALS